MNQQSPTPQASQTLSLHQRIMKFDQLVYERSYDDAHPMLIGILSLLENGKEGFGASLNDTGPLAETHATLLCAAVTRLYADKDFMLTSATFIRLTQYKRAMMQAFEVSGYRGTSHFIQCIGTPDEKGQRRLTKNEVAKLFLGLSVNALTREMLALLKRQPADISWPLVVGYLSEQIVWSKVGQNARAELLSWADHYKDMPTNYDMVRNIGPAYMGCSYDESDHKHDIKRAMNSLVRRWALEKGCTDIDMSAPRRAVKKKPTVVILAELYNSTHAMHRCYGPSIRALKERFKTIYMPITGKCEPALNYMFDKVDDTEFQPANPRHFIDKVKSYRPDIVYFPSIGMRFASIVASNIRMAPIQIFTPGHPATTHSEQMDYWAVVDGYIGDEKSFSEKALLWPSQPYFEMREDAIKVQPILAPESDTVRVAVPAWSRKVAPGFLTVCKQIQETAQKRVEFVFFPNGVGALYQAFARRVRTELNATVLPRTGYNEYIQELNRCDLYLSSVPFGSTNGLVDGLRQGLPVVNLKGQEVHARIDSDILSDDIQPAWLTATNSAEYRAAAVRLIDNYEERMQIRRHILQTDIDKKLLTTPDVFLNDFVTMFVDAYKHHEILMSSPQKIWTHEQIEGL